MRMVSEDALVGKLDAIAEQHRAPHLALAAQLLVHTAQERAELADGYALRFAADDHPALATLLGRMRLCESIPCLFETVLCVRQRPGC